MPKRKNTPTWVKTNVPWEIKVIIWGRMAHGVNDNQVGIWLDQQIDPRDPERIKTLGLNRDTIALVRKELEDCPEYLIKDTTIQIYEYWKHQPRHLDSDLSLRETDDKIIQDLQQFFVGRKDQLEWLDNFIKNQSKGYALIHGLPGSGKSALLANWLKHAKGKNKQYDIAYHFFLRLRANHEYESYLACLLQQLHAIYGKPLKVLRGESNELNINRYLGNTHDRKLIIIIDGIDEAWRSSLPGMFAFTKGSFPEPSELGKGTFIILSGRDLSSGNTLLEYEEKLGIPFNENELNLEELSQADISELATNKTNLKHYADDPEFILKIKKVTEGLAIYTNMLIRELDMRAGKKEDITVALKTIPEGLKNYVKHNADWIYNNSKEGPKWLEIIRLLAFAKGPVTRYELKCLMAEGEIPRIVSPEAQSWVKIIEDKGTENYLLCHQTLSDAWRSSLSDSDSKYYLGKFADFCNNCIKLWDNLVHNQSTYAICHASDHLYEAGRYDELFSLAIDDNFLETQGRIAENLGAPFTTLQKAMVASIERGNIQNILKFMLKHARLKMNIMGHSLILKAYDNRRLDQVWELCEMRNAVSRVNSYLLLASKLIRSGGPEQELEATLEKLLNLNFSYQNTPMYSEETLISICLFAQIMELVKEKKYQKSKVILEKWRHTQLLQEIEHKIDYWRYCHRPQTPDKKLYQPYLMDKSQEILLHIAIWRSMMIQYPEDYNKLDKLSQRAIAKETHINFEKIVDEKSEENQTIRNILDLMNQVLKHKKIKVPSSIEARNSEILQKHLADKLFYKASEFLPLERKTVWAAVGAIFSHLGFYELAEKAIDEFLVSENPCYSEEPELLVASISKIAQNLQYSHQDEKACQVFSYAFKLSEKLRNSEDFGETYNYWQNEIEILMHLAEINALSDLNLINEQWDFDPKEVTLQPYLCLLWDLIKKNSLSKAEILAKKMQNQKAFYTLAMAYAHNGYIREALSLIQYSKNIGTSDISEDLEDGFIAQLYYKAALCEGHLTQSKQCRNSIIDLLKEALNHAKIAILCCFVPELDINDQENIDRLHVESFRVVKPKEILLQILEELSKYGEDILADKAIKRQLNISKSEQLDAVALGLAKGDLAVKAFSINKQLPSFNRSANTCLEIGRAFVRSGDIQNGITLLKWPQNIGLKDNKTRNTCHDFLIPSDLPSIIGFAEALTDIDKTLALQIAQTTKYALSFPQNLDEMFDHSGGINLLYALAKILTKMKETKQALELLSCSTSMIDSRMVKIDQNLKNELFAGISRFCCSLGELKLACDYTNEITNQLHDDCLIEIAVAFAEKQDFNKVLNIVNLLSDERKPFGALAVTKYLIHQETNGGDFQGELKNLLSIASNNLKVAYDFCPVLIELYNANFATILNFIDDERNHLQSMVENEIDLT
jgi:hypothetical protein